MAKVNTIQEHRIEVVVTGDIVSGGPLVAMRPLNLRTRDDDGRPLRHTLVHCEVFDESATQAIGAGSSFNNNDYFVQQFTLTDAMPFQATTYVAGANTTGLPSVRSESVMFKETKVNQIANSNEDTQRFPLDTLFTSPTLLTYAPVLWCTASLRFHGSGNPTTIEHRLVFYVIIHSQTIGDKEHLMGLIAWRANIDFDWVSLQSMRLDGTTNAPSFYASYRRGGFRPELMFDPADAYQQLFGGHEGPENVTDYADLLLRGKQGSTVTDPDEAFGFQGFSLPDWAELTQLHLDARTRTTIPAIIWDATTNQKVVT